MKIASTQAHGSAFLDRVRKKNQNWIYESDLLKIIDCFIDCHGSANSDYERFGSATLNSNEKRKIFYIQMGNKKKWVKRQKLI